MNDRHFSPIPCHELPDWRQVNLIPIEESGEALHPVSLAPDPVRVYPVYFKMNIPGAPPECHLRTSVYKRLIEAASLLPPGISLIVLDGWRPFAVQQHLFETLLNLMGHIYPDTDREQLVSQARTLVSPPSTSQQAPSPHLTGGSVDVTLADQHGQMLPMGTAFDEASPLSYTASLERLSNPDELQVEARNNRRMLYNVMIAAGFTNLSCEWWHFDYGNQLWAWQSKLNTAIYGATHLESPEAMWQKQLSDNASEGNAPD